MPTFGHKRRERARHLTRRENGCIWQWIPRSAGRVRPSDLFMTVSAPRTGAIVRWDVRRVSIAPARACVFAPRISSEVPYTFGFPAAGVSPTLPSRALDVPRVRALGRIMAVGGLNGHDLRTRVLFIGIRHTRAARTTASIVQSPEVHAGCLHLARSRRAYVYNYGVFAMDSGTSSVARMGDASLCFRRSSPLMCCRPWRLMPGSGCMNGRAGRNARSSTMHARSVRRGTGEVRAR